MRPTPPLAAMISSPRGDCGEVHDVLAINSFIHAFVFCPINFWNFAPTWATSRTSLLAFRPFSFRRNLALH